MPRMYHTPPDVLPRHQHAGGFAAVVLRGRYAEAGDTGCHRVTAGDVLIRAAASPARRVPCARNT